MKETENQGEPVPVDGLEGSFVITASNKTGNDLRKKGRIVNGEKDYFRYQNSDELWIKNGTDSPENFLAGNLCESLRCKSGTASCNSDP